MHDCVCVRLRQLRVQMRRDRQYARQIGRPRRPHKALPLATRAQALLLTWQVVAEVQRAPRVCRQRRVQRTHDGVAQDIHLARTMCRVPGAVCAHVPRVHTCATEVPLRMRMPTTRQRAPSRARQLAHRTTPAASQRVANA